MGIVFAGISPHPPMIIPEIGGAERVKAHRTEAGLKILAQKAIEMKPDSVVIISPHGPVFQDGIVLNGAQELEGDFGNFGVSQVGFRIGNDRELIGEVERQCARQGITALEMNHKIAAEYGLSLKLDHGVLVPLYYLKKAGFEGSIVSVTMGLLSYPQLYKFGVCLQRAVEKVGRRVVVIASGDLSHCLTQGAPAGYTPEGAVFDKKLVELLDEFDTLELANLEDNLIEKAGECGLRPILMMLGVLDGYEVSSEIISYEGPFGVGYLIAAFDLGTKNSAKSLADEMFSKALDKVRIRRENESPLVSLARKSLEYYIKTDRKLSLEDLMEGKPIDAKLPDKAGIFVSIKKDGNLRGCIGTTSPTQANIAEEIIENAISAGIRDPRFFPVEEDELDSLIYSVDVLSDAEPIENLDQLDVKKYGVIVKSIKGRRVGLLLPNLEGIDSAGEQVRIAREKAGIGPADPIKLERFEVVRYY